MKQGGGKRKGGAWERKISKTLSNWWSGRTDDSIFWRTASSGGLATIRSKKNKKTFGQYGDIQAINPIGQPLIDLCVVECKCGYSSHNIHEMLDCCLSNSSGKYNEFFKQVSRDAHKAEAPFWLLFSQRIRKRTVVFMPKDFISLCDEVRNTRKGGEQSLLDCCLPNVQITAQIYGRDKDTIVGITLEDFLINISPDDIQAMHKDLFE